MFRRITASLAQLRPRTLAKTRATVDGLRADAGELKRTAKLLARQQEAFEARAAQWAADTERLADETRKQTAAVRELSEVVAGLALRESQLRATLQADAALEDRSEKLASILDAEQIAAKVRTAIDRAELRLDPFPHAIVDHLFPSSFYKALIRGIPPVELFADSAVNQQQLPVPFGIAPAYSRRVWRFMTDVVCHQVLEPLLIEKFRGPLEQWIAANWPMLAGNPLGPPMAFHSSTGRIMLRRRGYNIPPHRDPKWGFITCLLYLAKPGDQETWGTRLYTVEGDEEAVGALPHWIEEQQCHPAREVPFRRNSALVFLNSAGAHGASIPHDAEPAHLERYAYQFRIGPTRDAILALMNLLPEEHRAAWAGKLPDD